MKIQSLPRIPLGGDYDPLFEKVVIAFKYNMTLDPRFGKELGASVCVFLNGKKVVDIWGGYKDKRKIFPWERNTITCMMSIAKSCCAICCFILHDRGKLDFDKKVSDYLTVFLKILCRRNK